MSTRSMAHQGIKSHDIRAAGSELVISVKRRWARGLTRKTRRAIELTAESLPVKFVESEKLDRVMYAKDES